MPKIVSWSRVKLGPNRVYWVAVKWEEWQTIAEGYAPTINAAEDAARAAAGPDALRSTVSLARERHTAKVQATKVARHNDAESIKCIYTWDYSDYDNSRIVSDWQVVRETANRYYVRKPWQSASGRTFIVDRVTLEREGRVWCRSVSFSSEIGRTARRNLGSNSGPPRAIWISWRSPGR